MSEFNQTKYINDFIKETYDTIKVQVPKGQKEVIKQHSKAKGYKSVNEYMKALIDADMSQEQESSKTVNNNVAHNNGIVMGDNSGTINLNNDNGHS